MPNKGKRNLMSIIHQIIAQQGCHPHRLCSCLDIPFTFDAYQPSFANFRRLHTYKGTCDSNICLTLTIINVNGFQLISCLSLVDVKYHSGCGCIRYVAAHWSLARACPFPKANIQVPFRIIIIGKCMHRIKCCHHQF